MNEKQNLTKILEYEPYSCVMKNYDYADILFENEGLMTVPRNSANTITDLLNKAFKNGVKSVIKQKSLIESQQSQDAEWINPINKQKLQSVENFQNPIETPINTFNKPKKIKKFKIF